MPNECNQMGELQISLKDLLMRVLLGWRMILVWLVIGAVLLGGFGALRSYQQRQQAAAAQENPVAVQEDLLALREALTDAEAQEVEQTLALYQGDWQCYENLLEYQEKSLKMQLDATKVTTSTIWYRVDNHFQVEYPVVSASDNIVDIVFSYSLTAQDTSLYESMAGELGWDVEPSYLQELIRVEDERAEEGLFSVSVLSADAETGEAMLNAIAAAIEQATPQWQQLYGSFDITVLDRQTTTGMDPALMKEQQEHRNLINTTATACRSLSSYMTDDQEAYYEALVEQWHEEQLSAGAEVEEAPVEPTPLSAFQLIRVKYISLGAFVGAFLACVWLAARYLFSSRLRVAEDLPINYHVALLGVFPEADGKKKFLAGIDRWICRLFGRGSYAPREKALELVISQVKTAVAKGEMKQVYITGTGQSAESKALRTALCQAVQKEGIGAAEGDSVLWNAGSLEQMTRADGVILVEAVGESRYKDVQEEVILCRRYQVTVLGSAVVQDV